MSALSDVVAELRSWVQAMEKDRYRPVECQWHPSSNDIDDLADKLAAYEAATREPVAWTETAEITEEQIADGQLPTCPFTLPNCTIDPDQPCPVCGDTNDFAAESNCGNVTADYRKIARDALASNSEFSRGALAPSAGTPGCARHDDGEAK